MTWHLLMLNVTVKDGERALLTRNGQLVRVLAPGKHRLFDPLHELKAEVLDVVRSEFSADRYAVLKAARPDLAAELFEAIETKADEIAIVSLDGRPVHLMTPWQVRVYWKVATRIDVERIDVSADPRVGARHLTMIERNRSTVVMEAVVENHEAGLLYVEGRLVERLAPGRHAFWTVGRKIEVKRLDLRPQAVEITAQEMLTKDRIALRVTLTAFRRIVDPERTVATVPDVDAWLYRLVQFAIREAVAGRTLDEVLSAKAALDAELRDYVRARVAESGVEVTELGVKDVILPGEIRELVNKVVEAERVAKANLIRRQEETAATRSLLNTVRLMEENPLLLRLKELESLERLVEKVGRIDLHAGNGEGLDALLARLVRLKAPESA
ncbi:regulator of protease activity HflC (stomatin/prohibitin superfamily) [Bradyrhizobium japonicum]|uniref:slipin family protein n=1 Tax=Bradyrhizobium TaxID=374 RepID=UPI0004237DAA|nr:MULTISPECIES: slipin family protein [Bradyrhizobium]MBR0884560.1 slipin family protein [Bradyrhizobium liaoningense]MBR1004749.1 slipin family protein [Bradyrhizobium liaoningense]MBR1071073.1 slipin family protein [Bradyrhizobium liaoningense]MCP1742860.1 regulator of protease activity HflC (stomatin/prohibitin superfamily) [Bradyrhizobium japonicum]MCP1781215.1 regulator of protease activity HflC (stomatin/prohibitin superfamily) [Bradyrhizobium japonicum]